MFKSTKEFNSAMYKIMLNIRDGKLYPKDFDLKIDEEACYDAVKRAVALGYIDGITFINGLSGYKASLNARLTYDGLEYLEENEEHYL